MHYRVIVSATKEGLRYRAQVVDDKEIYNVGTFDRRARAEVSAKIFIYWCMTMTEVNRHRVKNNYFKDAI